jgi:hypothetical protein
MDYYYKATRPDGTDFRTGTVLYEVGKRTVHPTSKRRVKDDPSTYLSVATVPTDCTGFKWPCRLFLVKGVGRAMKATDLQNKRAFLSVDVIEELPAHEVFGPQGEHVVRLIDRAARLTRDEAKQLAAAAYAARAAAGVAAWVAAWDAAWNAASYAPRDAARDAASYAPRAAARDAAGDAAGNAVWGAARGAAGDAAMALVVRDLIGSSWFSQAHYDVLTRPWRKVIGPVHPDDEPLEGSK